MDPLYCDVCDRRMDSDFNLEQHLNGKEHRRKWNNRQLAIRHTTTSSTPKTVVTMDFDFPVKSYTNIFRNEPAPVIRPQLTIRPPQVAVHAPVIHPTTVISSPQLAIRPPTIPLS